MNWRGTIQEYGAAPMIVAEDGRVLAGHLWARIAQDGMTTGVQSLIRAVRD